jgi:hypothetical protein
MSRIFFPVINGRITVQYLAEARLEVSCSSFISLIFCTSQLHLDNNCWYFYVLKKSKNEETSSTKRLFLWLQYYLENELQYV